jgi:hypothetical protein
MINHNRCLGIILTEQGGQRHNATKEVPGNYHQSVIAAFYKSLQVRPTISFLLKPHFFNFNTSTIPSELNLFAVNAILH